MARARLEGAVLDALWDHPDGLTAQELRVRLEREDGAPAVTTVLTALSRLTAKGHVRRVGARRPQVFAAARTREQHAAGLLQDILGSSPDHEAVLAAFVGGISDADAAALRRLLT
ncbi:BlaI/MecI/CopY family transcriptional regulator [Micrococcus porci]|nr:MULTISPECIES: BlaI/MecI/CopY family transcriptional regulator [Micrococcus]MCG7421595.1 BlaI/MecI/CopY family transcriptional regulator [Micrococcus sp. ACRRV]UBH25868.1 BlaI/MecI/CopY family transcriptional regulator [Micrococcus porci]